MRFSPPLQKSVILAFSGGKDSIACAHFLKFRCRKEVTLLHVNNKLPGDDWIALRVKTFADRFGFPIIIEESESKPTEIDCREARISVFKKYKSVVICHHNDDVVENYLYNVFRGHSNYIPLRRETYYGDCLVLRPFLKVKGKDIENYLKTNGLKNWIVEDPLSKDSTRGWMRSVLIPVIERKFNIKGLF